MRVTSSPRLPPILFMILEQSPLDELADLAAGLPGPIPIAGDQSLVDPHGQLFLGLFRRPRTAWWTAAAGAGEMITSRPSHWRLRSRLPSPGDRLRSLVTWRPLTP